MLHRAAASPLRGEWRFSGEVLANHGHSLGDRPAGCHQFDHRRGFQQAVAIRHLVVLKDTPAEVLGKMQSMTGRLTIDTGTPRVFDGKDLIQSARLQRIRLSLEIWAISV